MSDDPQFPSQHGELVTPERRPTSWWYNWFRKVNTRITAAQETADAAAVAAATPPEPVYPVIDGQAPVMVLGPDDHRTILLDPAFASGVARMGPPGRDGRPGRDAWPIPGPKGDTGATGAAGASGSGSGGASGAHMLPGPRPANVWDPNPTPQEIELLRRAVQGDLIYRGATGLALLSAGTSGYFLKTQGSAADPVWGIPGTPIDTTVVTFNSADKSANITLSSGDLIATKSAAGDGHSLVRLNVARETGDWYFEFDITADNGTGNNMVGVCDPDDATANYVGQGTNGAAYYGADGNKYRAGSSSGFGSTFTTGVIGVAWSASRGWIWFAKNNVWQASGAPATFKNRALTTLPGMFPALSIYKGSSVVSVRLRAKSSDLTYTPPTGFLPYDQN